MAEELGEQVWLSSPVALIEQLENSCRVTLENGKSIETTKIVIATSPAMSSRIRFNPPLPACRDALTQAHLMGHVIKTITFYETPFWIEAGFSGEGISDQNIRLTFDASYPEKNVYGLVGFFLGDSALEWCDRTQEERKQACVEHFVRVFGPEAANPVHYIENNWPSEPYIRGAYMSIPPPNVLTRVGPAIRKPIGNIHFAGTETATEWSGYMEGGLQAAERVATELKDIQHTPLHETQPTSFNSERKGRNQMTDHSTGNVFTWKR
eukprot:CAMPEP_0206201254 /NCGR_PEP_ID=MMETSP0166-20121206/11407_1 /ASSEMBLY_ACC=CAM_ASM_000260 /TAXON_ID=95228 /ORGANISM="Vannella robusta, Strain DIVA3 518/3/11/1/6" /LENGTH=265 /DNA_ID=CAMNT_0053619831 /DNA_START=614 /DNA_END=1407 /DNA_ORIENTATION=-